MAVSNVELIVSAAKAINPLRKVEAATKRVEAAFNKAQSAIRKIAQKLRGAGRDAQQTSKAFDSLASSVKSAAIGYASFATAQSIVNAAISRTESERRIKALAKGYGEVEALSQAAANASVNFGQSQTTANKALANVYARLRPVGTSLEEIVSTYNGFNTAARLSGATAVEAENAFTQLAQALGSGALRGDEFNSISEQVPGILTAISKETGIAQGQLRAYAAEGMITSDVVIRALQRIEREGADQLAESLKGPQQQMQNLTNRTEDLQVAIGNLALPIVLDIVNDLTTGIETWATTIDNLTIAFSGLSGVLGPVLDRLIQVNDLISKFGPLTFALNSIPGLSEMMVGGKPKKAQDGKPAVTPPTPVLPTPISLPKRTGRSRGARPRATKERVDMSQRLYELNKDLREQQLAGNELEIATLELMIKRQKIAEDNLLPLEKRNALEEALFAFKQKNIDIDRQQAEERDNALKSLAEEEKARQELLQKQLEADPGYQMKQQLEELVKLENQVAAGAQAISNAFANSFRSLITGAKSGEEALADMMSAVAEHFLEMATKIIAQQLAMILYGTIMKALGVSMPKGPGFGGPNLNVSDSSPFDLDKSFFAEGGFVNKPTNAIIGEGSEPEYVIPESKMKESMMRYSRGARGNSVIPESGKGGASGEGSGTAVAAPIDVRYSVERINNVDYVTADQFQAGMRQAAQQGAKQGEQQTLRRLQMSSSTRRRLGV